MLGFEEALARILALGSPVLASERVDLDDAEGRVLAVSVSASSDLPAFDYSTMDGYAVRTRDLEGAAPLRLHVRGESRTGALAPALEARAAMRIFTGAPIPEGADSVIMQENVAREGDVAILAARPLAGQHIRRRGEDLSNGAVAIAAGTRLRPAHLALAAAIDLATLPVTTRPVVSILATGDELRRPGTERRPGSIPESNTVALRSMARRAGADARVHAFVRDERTATERAFAQALEESDVLVTVGGVSVGDHDFVRPALEAVGVTLEFWRVAIKPGKPLAIGRFPRVGKRDAIVVGLPGNPASAMITFAVFGVALLRAMQGDALPFPPFRRATMLRAHGHDPGRLELARAVVTHGAGGLAITPFGNQASGAVTTMAQADALACIPQDSTGISAGEQVDVLLMSDLCG